MLGHGRVNLVSLAHELFHCSVNFLLSQPIQVDPPFFSEVKSCHHIRLRSETFPDDKWQRWVLNFNLRVIILHELTSTQGGWTLLAHYETQLSHALSKLLFVRHF